MEEYKNWVYKIVGIIFLIYVCGECCSTLFSDESDGKLDQVDVQVGVKTHLRETLYDYDSYKSLSWSDFKEYSDGGYSIVHKYKATNLFGGYVTKTTKFYVDKNGVVVDYFEF